MESIYLNCRFMEFHKIPLMFLYYEKNNVTAQSWVADSAVLTTVSQYKITIKKNAIL